MTAPKPTSPTGMSVTVFQVTPDLARQWLDTNTHNRRVRQRAIDGYARDMEAGAWTLNGEALKFATNGDLLDGQHRLHAVIKSGCTVPMLVVRGLPPATQDTMDTGLKRSAGDVLALNGYKHTILLAAVARLVHAYLSTGSVNPYAKATTAEIEELVALRPDVVDAVDTGGPYHRALAQVMLPSVVHFCWWRLVQVNAGAAQEFFDGMAYSATNGKGDPRHTLLSTLARRKMTTHEQVWLTLTAWNSWRKGRQVHRLSYTPGTPLPEPI